METYKSKIESTKSLIKTALKMSKNGRTSSELEGILQKPIRTIRIGLKELKQKDIISWRAEWSGKNSGYKIKYFIKDAKNKT
ncbi:MAG: hypothetical protein AABY15_03370 [Nanoarchaeota archaeon]